MRLLNAWGECWHDSSLGNITISYDEAIVTIERNNKIISLNCPNFLGIKYLGQWDENIIKSITISEDNQIINQAKDEIRRNNNLSVRGESRDLNSQWKCLCIELLDSVVIQIICKDVFVE